jgi:short-subunit dehydrogenase
LKKPLFQGTVAIITGASSGIGRALALKLAGQKARVVLAARRADLLEQGADECRQAGGEALAVPTDVSDESQCKTLVEKAVARFGGVDLLVNNAGLTVIARLEDYRDLSLFKYNLDVNFFGAVYCTYHALPYLEKREGRIVAVSSIAGRVQAPYNSAYAASKFAMQAFFDSIRIELIPHRVSVTMVSPYWVVTGFHEAQMNRDGESRGPAGRAIYTDKMMSAARCADVILQAAMRRKREVVMGPGRIIAWFNLLAPALTDRIVVSFLRAAVRRENKNIPPGLSRGT